MSKEIKSLQIKLASPEEILSWSRGEVLKSETINYRTQKAEPQGLMCEAIFGPSKNYECYCGKYRKIRYKGIVCDKCGVEVTLKKVRRERLGHIKLAAPVAHIWYSHGAPNKLALILNIPQSKLESVLYFSRHIVIGLDEEKREKLPQIIAEKKKQKLAELNLSDEVEQLEKTKVKSSKKMDVDMSAFGKEVGKTEALGKIKSEINEKLVEINQYYEKLQNFVESLFIGEVVSEDDLMMLNEEGIDFISTGIGAEAIRELLNIIDDNIETILTNLEERKSKCKSELLKKKLTERYRILKGIFEAGLKSAWIIMSVIPVIPPDLRPIVQLPGGRYATSDLNDLYRRVINRNNRLKKLTDLGAPELILRNEKRMLQEAVDVLMDNSHRTGQPILNTKGQAYKSLSDALRGKTGRFRQNLLGKRVDYSGRAVIVVGPELSVYECGLPKMMALELFRPYLIHEIITRGYAVNTKSAKSVIDERPPQIYGILEDIIKGRPILLNRAPTLHKQGILAFFPVLIEGNAIKINPLVCKGFNADFDGDQMAVHLPLSIEAQQEAIDYMMADSNVLLMRDGSPVIQANKDMVTGCYVLTKMDSSNNDPVVIPNTETVLRHYDLGIIKLTTPIKTIIDNEIVVTTAGRIIFNNKLPENYGFLNKQFDSSAISSLISDIFIRFGPKDALTTLDHVKNLGFTYLTKSGLSLGISDYILSPNREVLLQEANDREDQLNDLLTQGLISETEKPRLSQKIWTEVTDKMTKETLSLYKDDNPLIVLDKSGGLPATDPLKSSVVMKGMIADVTGKAISLPLRSNYVLGFNSFEYFVSSRGTRKGEADKALKTSASGYLTRKLCDVGQSQIIRTDDCGSTQGIIMSKSQERRQAFDKRIYGRYVLEDVMNPLTNEVIVKAGDPIEIDSAKLIASIPELDTIKVRSPLTCECEKGLCAKCYGYSLGTQHPVEMGIAVGIISGQAMGEASTQLTMNSKHTAAKLGGADITQGLPRIEELYECRTPKAKALIAKIDGTVTLIDSETAKLPTKLLRISSEESVEKRYTLKEGDEQQFSRAKKVKKDDVIVKMQDGNMLLAPINGAVKNENGVIIFSSVQRKEVEYEITKEMILMVLDGDKVSAGQQLTEGSLDPKDLMMFGDINKAERYLIDHIQKVYGVQGVTLDDKHIETIVRMMGGYVKVVDAGDSDEIVGGIISYYRVKKLNKELDETGKKTIKYIRLLLGITNAAINTESFLSAASFQEQVPVLSNAALRAATDDLIGLKENVIIGKPVPLRHNVK